MKLPPQGLIPLNLVMPVSFLKACGCCGRSNYIGLWWMAEKDELASSDGHCCVVGMRWPAWVVFWDKESRFQGDLYGRGINFGASQQPATHMLMVERETRQAYAIDFDSGQRFLSEQKSTFSQEEIARGFERRFSTPDDKLRRNMTPRGLRNKNTTTNALHALRDELGLWYK